MSTTCDLAAQDVGSGVLAALTAVDCIASQVSEQAFGRLFASGGQLAIILVVLLTLYIAFFGFRLTLGRSSLSMSSLVPRVITIGLVVTFATSFAVFSTVFYSLFVFGPDWLAGLLTGSEGSATATFAAKLDVVFIAVQQASAGQQDISAFSPPGMMWLGALFLLLGTVGLLVTARIGLALLLAVGPILVVMALFDATRGLFVGWLKGMVMLALVPVFAVAGGSIMLEMAVPILSNLVAVPGQIDQQAAMAFFIVGFVHCALMLMALIVSSVMVARWQVFGLTRNEMDTANVPQTARPAPAPAPAPIPGRTAQLAPGGGAGATQRRAEVTPGYFAANDAGTATSPGRQTVVYASTAQGAEGPKFNTGASRTRGIGNRFKSAPRRRSQPASTTENSR